MSEITHEKPSRQQLVTFTLVLAVIVHLNYAGAQRKTDPNANTVVVLLSKSDLNRITLIVNFGDTVILRCTQGFYAQIIQQTEAQLVACDNSVNNPTSQDPVSITACFGNPDDYAIRIETASEILESSQVFEPGNSYYYTSYSLEDLMEVGVGLFGRQYGGLCYAGFALELKIYEQTASTPVTTVESQATMDGTDESTGNVYDGNTGPTIGGPTIRGSGVDEPSASTTVISIGGLNSANHELFIIAGVCSVVAVIILVLFAIILCGCLYYKKCRRGELKNIEAQEVIAEDSAEFAVKPRKTKTREQQLKSKLEKETSKKVSQQQSDIPARSTVQKTSDKQNKIKPANENRIKNPVNRNGTQTDGKNITTRSASRQPASKGSRQPVPKSGLYYKKCRRGELKNIETQEVIAEDSTEFAAKPRKTKTREQQLKSKLEKETSKKVSQQQSDIPARSTVQKTSDKQNKIKPANEDRTKNPVNRNGTQTDGKNITTRSASHQPASKGSSQPVPKSGPKADTEARKSLSFASGTKSSSCKPQTPAPTRPRSSTRNGSAKSDQPHKSVPPVNANKNRSTNQTKKSVSVNT